MSNNQDRKQVFLGSLHYDATEAEIVAAFSGINVAVTNVRIPRDKETGRAKGFAFVDIDSSATLSVEEIISGIDGVMFRGRPCRADRVNEKPEHAAHVERREQRGSRQHRGGRGKDRDDSEW